jgi:hypothetical protein
MAIARGQGNAQRHSLLIDDVDEARLAGRMAHRADDESLPEKRMGGIGNRDRLSLRRVLETGIKAWLLSTAFRTTN